MCDRKIKMTRPILYFSVTHFSVWFAEMMIKAARIIRDNP